MGFVFPLAPPPPEYPGSVICLDQAERLLLHGLRLWLLVRRQKAAGVACPAHTHAEAFTAAGLDSGAAAALDAWMQVVLRTASRTLDMHCPRCAGVSQDETWMLAAVASAQRGAEPATRRALRNFLSWPGVDFAQGAVEGLAESFAEAGMPLRWRRLPDGLAPDAVKPGDHGPDDIGRGALRPFTSKH